MTIREYSQRVNEMFKTFFDSMEAPEKIYLQPSAIEQLPNQNIVYTKPLTDNSIEYIRKDALIEKFAEFLDKII